MGYSDPVIRDISFVPLDDTIQSYVIFGSSKLSQMAVTTHLKSSDPSVVEVQETLVMHDIGTRSISLISDINNDNVSDLIIGDPLQSKAYIFFGPHDSDSSHSYSLDFGFTVVGNVNSNVGWTVGGGEHSIRFDFNGDGINDFFVSGFMTGVAYVIFGQARFSDIILSSLTSLEGLRLTSGSTLSNGVAVSSAGDFNGDGFDDLLITGMTRSNNLQGNTIYVVYGGKDISQAGGIALDNLSKSQMVRIVAPSWSFAGVSLSWLGDFNGDGFDDIVIGSVPFRGQYLTQMSYVVYGNSSRQSQDLYLSELKVDEGFTFEGGGLLVSGVGDVSGDGLNDLLIINYDNWKGHSSSYLMKLSFSASPHPTSFPSSSPSSHPSITITTSPTHPTVIPTSLPSKPTSSPTPTPTLLTQSPSTIPTKLLKSSAPTFALRRSAAPTSLRPSTSYPTFESSRPTSIPTSGFRNSFDSNFNVSHIIKGGSYSLEKLSVISNQKIVYIIESPDDVLLHTNPNDIHIYIILPGANMSLTIDNFNLDYDIIDFSAFTALGMKSMNDLSYQVIDSHLTLCLPNHQLIHLLNVGFFALEDKNFIFSEIYSPSELSSPTESWSFWTKDLVISLAFMLVLGFLSIWFGFRYRHFLEMESESLEKIYLKKDDNSPPPQHYESLVDTSSNPVNMNTPKSFQVLSHPHSPLPSLSSLESTSVVESAFLPEPSSASSSSSSSSLGSSNQNDDEEFEELNESQELSSFSFLS